MQAEDAMTSEAVLDLILKGGLLTALLVAMYMGATKKWVFGWVYEQSEKRGEEWRRLAMEDRAMLYKAIATLEEATRQRGVRP